MPAAISEQIPGISDSGAELLGAVGVEGCGALAQSDPGSLWEEMGQANKHLELVETLPSLDEVISWIKEAREIQGEAGPPLITRLEDVTELVPIELLAAIPVTASSIKKNKIPVSEVPEMVEFLGKDDLLEERVVRREGGKEIRLPVREIAPKASSGGNESSDNGAPKKIEPLKRNVGFDIRKTASPELNEGKKLHSRDYIRGVLHPQPSKVKVGAFFTIISFLLLPATFVVGILILTVFKGQAIMDHLWLLGIPAAFLGFGLFYLILAKPVKCRVCGQPIFSPKACRRNPKAHRVPLLGYIFPTALHLSIYHWFRCIYCGTSIRLKK